MAIADDISIDISGNFRWTGAAGTTYTVLEFHRYIGALMDDAQASGDDLLDITSETASARSTDQIITLNSAVGIVYNIDDTLAEHLYDGSITQDGGNTVYSGLSVVGTVVAGTEPMIVQDNRVLPAYWGTGVNADAANLIIMKIMVKSREGGADIDGKRIKLLARELGDQYREFPVTLGLANSVGAISNQADLNNATIESTIEGWTIGNTEGFQNIDIDGTAVGDPEEYYSQWDPGIQNQSDTYEYTKWVSQRSHIPDSGTDTGNDFTVDDATVTGQAQEFTANAQNEILTEMVFKLKVGAGTPVGVLVAELWLSDDAGAGLAEPTGAVLATSQEVLVSKLHATVYDEFIFRFEDSVTLTANEAYFAVIRNVAADVSNTVSIEGSTAGAHAGNRAQDASGVWTATAADDLWFEVKSSPPIHGIAGERFRGIDFEIVYDTGSGTFTEDEVLFWGTDITYDTLAGGPFTEGEYVTFDIAGTIHNAGKILRDNGTVQMMVALELITGGTLADGDIITGLTSGATAAINTTIVDQTKDGGEGILLAHDDNAGTGDVYIQLISGKAPVDNLPLEGRSSGATALVNATVNTKVANPEFIGVSTGTNIIGAYGIGFVPAEVGASDQFTSLDGATRTPPNNVTVTVTGLVSGEDYVLLGPRAAGVMDKAQMTLLTNLGVIAETAVVATASIPAGTPTSGEALGNTRLRVQQDNGVFRRQSYASFSSATFTLNLPVNAAVQIDATAAGTFTRASGSFLADGFAPECTFTGSNFTSGGNNQQFIVGTVTATVITVKDATGMVTEAGSGDELLTADGWNYNDLGANQPRDMFIAYIDVLADATSETYTAVHTGDVDLLLRIRDGGASPIVTIENPITFSSASFSTAIVRQSDL